MADAKVIQRHIARYSEDPAFLNNFQEIADDLVRAEVTAAERQWSLAAECYARIVQCGMAIKDAVARREAEERLRREAAEKAPCAALPKTGDVKVIVLPGGEKMGMIYVAPGSFMMGSPESEDGRGDDETLHRVTLTNGYWMGKYPVTQRQWESVMGGNPSHFNGKEKVYEEGMLFWKKTCKTEAFDSANYPVENISWDDCQVFVKKVNAALGCGARLPTEAEWEYACRAGTTGPYGGNGNLDDMGWYQENSGDATHPVGQKKPNAWGFHDMHGNVWEWCQDWYGDYQGDANDPQGPVSGCRRVLRGGSWRHDVRDCRSAFRGWFGADCRDCNCGFRLCCSVGPRGGAEQ